MCKPTVLMFLSQHVSFRVIKIEILKRLYSEECRWKHKISTSIINDSEKRKTSQPTLP